MYFIDSANALILTQTRDDVLHIVAGNGIPGFSGDGGSAEAASIFGASLAVDNTGSIYFADYTHHVVRQISPSGVIKTIAGTGQSGYTGDGGPAVQAKLNQPRAVAVDSSGNVFIATQTAGGVQCVRRVSPSGMISTFAGGGTTTLDGVAAMSFILPFALNALAVSQTGELFVGAGTQVFKVAGNGTITTVAGNGTVGVAGDGGPALKAQFYSINGVYVDSAGNVYVSDFSCRVRRVSTSGIINTIAGTGFCSGFSGDGGPATQASLDVPGKVALDASGNLYLPDVFNSRVRRVDTKGIITTIAGNGRFRYGGDGGPAANAYLNKPTALAIGPDGSLFFADASSRVRKVDPRGNISTVIESSDQLNIKGAVSGIGVDPLGNLYIGSSLGRIWRILATGVVELFAGNGCGGSGCALGDGGPALQAAIAGPTSFAFDAVGNVYFADPGNIRRIRKVDRNGIVTTVAGNGTATYPGDGGKATAAGFGLPSAIAFDSSGNLLVADQTLFKLRWVSTDGTIHTEAAYNILGQPTSVAIDGLGQIYVRDGYKV